MALRGWTVIDAQGYGTNVILDRIETDVPLDGELFVYRNPDFNPELRRRDSAEPVRGLLRRPGRSRVCAPLPPCHVMVSAVECMAVAERCR